MSYDHLYSKKESLAEAHKKTAPKIIVHQRSISCPDALKDKNKAHHIQQKHPRVMIELSKENKQQVCYYCGTVYVYEPE